jgi:hypothetical protein
VPAPTDAPAPTPPPAAASVPAPTGPPDWIGREVEAERHRRELQARQAREAEERARAQAERQIRERDSLNKRFAEAEDRLERKLEQVEDRLHTTQRLANWADHIAGLQDDELARVLRSREAKPISPSE